MTKEQMKNVLAYAKNQTHIKMQLKQDKENAQTWWNKPKHAKNKEHPFTYHNCTKPNDVHRFHHCMRVTMVAASGKFDAANMLSIDAIDMIENDVR